MSKPLPPPGVRWTFHGTILIENYAQALDWLGRFCGCVALQYVEADAPVWRRGGCCAIADNVLEFMEPNAEDAPTARALKKYGPAYYNLALQVEDLKEACAFFNANGAETTVPAERGFTFTRPSGTAGIQLEWADLESEWDPRFGAAVPPGPDPLVPVPRVAWWGALVADPARDVERLALLCGSPPIFLRADAPDDEPVSAISLKDGLFMIYRLPADQAVEQRLWGKALGRPRLHAMALRVRDLDRAAGVFAREHVGVLRRGAGELVTEPADTLGLTMVWTDKDHPFDPRGPLAS